MKDLYVEKKDKSVAPFLQVLNDWVKKGEEVRLIHAKEPGTAFREDFDKYPALWGGMERRLCPRVHMKIFQNDDDWTEYWTRVPAFRDIKFCYSLHHMSDHQSLPLVDILHKTSLSADIKHEIIFRKIE